MKVRIGLRALQAMEHLIAMQRVVALTEVSGTVGMRVGADGVRQEVVVSVDHDPHIGEGVVFELEES